jgi:hypothetical protein
MLAVWRTLLPSTGQACWVGPKEGWWGGSAAGVNTNTWGSPVCPLSTCDWAFLMAANLHELGPWNFLGDSTANLFSWFWGSVEDGVWQTVHRRLQVFKRKLGLCMWGKLDQRGMAISSGFWSGCHWVWTLVSPGWELGSWETPIGSPMNNQSISLLVLPIISVCLCPRAARNWKHSFKQLFGQYRLR